MAFTHPEQAAAGPSPGLAADPELGETLKVLSRDTVTLRFQWNSRLYLLPPGGEVFMPFDAVKVYTGDPRATNLTRTLRDSIGIVSFLPDRETEVRRLRLLYMAPFGEYMAAESAGGIFQDPKNRHSPTGGAAFEGVRVPQVEVYNIRGERIITVLEDPEGDAVKPANQTVAGQNAYEAVISQQQSVINAMAARLGMDPTTGALLNSPDITGEHPDDDGEELPEAAVTDPHDIETHEDGSPKMVYDQRKNEVRTRRRTTPSDPKTIDDLPEDQI